MNPQIFVGSKNRIISIEAQVKDSLHASLLADRLNKLSYLKVTSRKFNEPKVQIIAHAIPGLFTIQQLHDDLDTMSDLIVMDDESV